MGVEEFTVFLKSVIVYLESIKVRRRDAFLAVDPKMWHVMQTHGYVVVLFQTDILCTYLVLLPWPFLIAHNKSGAKTSQYRYKKSAKYR